MRIALVALVGMLAAIAPLASAQYNFNTIAQSGQQAAGLDEGVVFTSFAQGPVLNGRGDIVFIAIVGGPGITEANNEGIWIRRDGELELVAVEGMAAPDTGGVFGGELIDVGERSFADRVEIGHAGHVAFRASITGGESDVGIWRTDEEGEQLRLLARVQDPPPDVPAGVAFTGLGGPFAITDSGMVAFRATLEGDDLPSFSVGIFIAEPGFAALVAADGLPPAGRPFDADLDDLGAIFNHTPLADIRDDPTGGARTVFTALRIPEGADLTEHLWFGGETQDTRRIIDPGDPAPGTAGTFVDNNFQPFTTFTINSEAAFIFRAGITFDENPADAELAGLFRANVFGTPTPIFIEGQAPGFVNGIMLTPISGAPINAFGGTIFAGSLSGDGVTSANDRTLWAAPTPLEEPTLIAREDDPAPGTFNRRFDNLPALVPISNAGTTAFMADLTSTGFGSPDGIFATDPSHELHLVMFEGQFVDFDGDGLTETVRSLSMRSTPAGDEDGMSSPLHDDGRVVFNASLDDFTSRILEAIPDADGDGLWDIWEEEGIDVNGDGTIDLDLPAMGADPLHKDLFVEVDAMSDFIPDPSIAQMLIDAFADAPVENPDGITGIDLHFATDAARGAGVADETSLPTVDFPNAWDDADDGTPGFDTLKEMHFGTVAERADPNWTHIREAKLLAFRYCIFGKTYDNSRTSAGLAEQPGNDFMVTLGPLRGDGSPGFPNAQGQPGGTPEQQAGIFMHELGHNLNLDHGGPPGSINLKPNYYSVMNYLWTEPKGPAAQFWRLDYSRHELPTLDESALDEAIGIQAPLDCFECFAAQVPYDAAPLGEERVLLGSLAPGDGIDWDGDGVIAGVVRRDPNSIGGNRHSPDQILPGHDDWSNLRLAITGPENFAEGVHVTDTADDEYDQEMADLLLSLEDAGCPADLDGSGDVGMPDLSEVLGMWGQPDSPADLDGDGDVGAHDLALLLGAWGPCE